MGASHAAVAFAQAKMSDEDVIERESGAGLLKSALHIFFAIYICVNFSDFSAVLLHSQTGFSL